MKGTIHRLAGVALAIVAAICAAATLAACGSSTSSGGSSSKSTASSAKLTVGYFTGLVAIPETVVGSVPALQKEAGAQLKWVPITAGATALAEMRSGAFDVVAGVGNPPTVAAIGNGTPIDIVWAEYLDADGLMVPASITQPSQLVGKTVGDLEGSSENYELNGWLKLEGLSGKVKVVGFESEQAAAAAYLAGKIDAAYVEGAPQQSLAAKGAYALTNAKQIANRGVASLDVVAVSQKDVKSEAPVIQRFICSEMDATKDLLGSDNKKYFASSAKLLGVSAADAVAATETYVPYFITVGDELHWLQGGTSSPLVASYVKTAQFDKAQGDISTVPSAATFAAHVDPTFAENAIKGKC